MTAYTNKPTRLLKAIEEQVAFLLGSGAVITHAFDNADPKLANEYLSIAFSGQTHLVRIVPETAPASGTVDGLGLTQRVYVPDVVQVGIDTSAEAGGLDADTEKARAALYIVASGKNARTTVYAKSGIVLADMVDGDASTVLNYQPAYDGWGYLVNQ